MKNLLIIFLLFVSTALFAQQSRITGMVTGANTGEPVAGASISVKDKIAGSITDSKGAFSLSISKIKLPFFIIISAAGYVDETVEISANGQNVDVKLHQREGWLNEVVFAASRVQESILRSPVSIEKMNLKAVRENPSFSFYDAVQNLKSVEAVTSSLTYKQINTRGY